LLRFFWIPTRTAHRIPIAQAFRLTPNLGENVANEINCSGYKQKIKGRRSKKKSTTAKPDCLKVDGTLYHKVNVMIQNQEQVKTIKEAHDKDDADSRNPKVMAFGFLFADYCSSDASLKNSLRLPEMLLLDTPLMNPFSNIMICSRLINSRRW